MAEPPNDDEPQDEVPSGDDLESVEPPLKLEDTRPLKPLSRPDGWQSGKSSDTAPPPAAVLHEAPSHPRRPTPHPPSPMEETDRVRLVPPVPEPDAWRLILHLVEPHESRIGLNVWQRLVIGRMDASHDQPDLDLAPHRAIELGVSRQHAMLVPGRDGLYLLDLGSTNGTWINGKYLPPEQRYRLTVDDKIELGLMKLVVRSVTPLTRATEDD